MAFQGSSRSSVRASWSVLFLMAVFGAMPVYAATDMVTNTNDAGPGSLRDVIANAANGDTVEFSVTGTITLTSGDIFISQSSLNITGPGASSLAISGNNSSRIFDIGAGAVVSISGLTIENGSAAVDAFDSGTPMIEADTGGGIRNTGTLTVSNCTFSNNSASFYGGAIYNFPEKTLIVMHSTLSGNSAVFGGGIYNDSDNISGSSVTVSDSTFSGNSAGAGGGIYDLGDSSGITRGGTVTVSYSTFSGNTATNNSGLQGSGGGILLGTASVLTVTSSIFSNNSALPGAFPQYATQGGAIANFGSGTVTGSTFSGNSAAFGGAINFSGYGFTLTVTNSTISGNSAVGGDGGGLWVRYGASATLISSTVAGNFALDGADGAGINAGPESSVTLKNTILANGSSGANCAVGNGTITSQDHNIADDTSCDAFLTLPGDLPNTPAGLDPSGLQNNGGPTKTIALLYTSKAIDAIALSSDCTVTTDQRGVSRPQGLYCDIGAFELTPNFYFSAIAPVTATLGGPGSSTVTVNSVVGFDSAVTLTASGLRAGLSASFGTNPVTPPGYGSASSTLSVSVGPSVSPGTYTFNVMGTDAPDSLSHSTQAQVKVEATSSGTSTVVGELQALGCINNTGISGSLLNKLATAQAEITAGDIKSAINTLDALLHEIEAQSGNHIGTTCTDANGNQFNPVQVLISDVEALLASLQAMLPASVASTPNPILGSAVNSNSAGLAGATVSLFSGKGVVATAVTDATGFFYFPATSTLVAGSSYTVEVTAYPAGYKKSTPASRTFVWGGAATTLGNFVLY